ncbi:hypothetical protein JCM8097_001772 [Rhodosporidiobolus ruineniae]
MRPSLLLAATAAFSASLAHAASPGAHAAGSAHHAVRDAILASRAQAGAAHGGGGSGSLLMDRAAELEADQDVDEVGANRTVGYEDDDEAYAGVGGGEEDDAAEWFAGSEYEAVVRLQEQAAAAAVAHGKAAHAKRAGHEKRLVKNPKYVPNPKWSGGSSSSSSASSSSASKSGAAASKTASRDLAASTQIIVGTPTSSSASRAVSTASKTTSSASPTYTLAKASSGCATRYTTTTGGAVYGPQIVSGAALLAAQMPRPSTFIVRSKNKLYLDGNEFRIAGPNIYWLGLDENVNYAVSYPSHSRIREAMAMTVALGGNTIRAHTLGVSKTLWPKAYQTNTAAWDTIDYSIYAAREYGLRLIIPLSDNYAYYHGGKYDFISWGGGDTSDGSEFYYNDDVVAIFKDFIELLLTHNNTYTGVALKDDPTILAWETGNEYGGYMLGGGAPPASWTKSIAQYIKSLAPNHLVADGTDGLTDYGGSLANTGVTVDEVDLVTDHFYPALQWLLEKDAGWMKSYTNKVFYVGENDWTGQKGGADLDTFYSYIKNSMPGSGSMMWSLFGHDDACCNWITHNDGYTLNYPNGVSSTLQASALKLMKHWYSLRGLTAPSVLPAVACPQVELS